MLCWLCVCVGWQQLKKQLLFGERIRLWGDDREYLTLCVRLCVTLKGDFWPFEDIFGLHEQNNLHIKLYDGYLKM